MRADAHGLEPAPGAPGRAAVWHDGGAAARDEGSAPAWSALSEAARLERVGTLLRVTAATADGCGEPAAVPWDVAQEVCRVLRWPGARVWSATAGGLDGAHVGGGSEASDALDTAASDALAEQVRSSGEPAVGRAGPSAVLLVPVPVSGRVEAVIGFVVGEGTAAVDDALNEVVGHVVARAGLVIERARHVAQVEAANVELRRSNAELEQFAYVASHDLQEPLRKVASYCALLQRRYGELLDEDGREFVAYAVDGAVRMKALINDLLEYSRVGRSGHEASRVALGSVVSEALGSLEVAVEESGAEIDVAGGLPEVHGHRNELVALVGNLLSNALKFRGADAPQVRVDGEVSGGRARLSVRDNGVGIDARYHERVFGIFQRLHGRAEYAGTGIGLALCRRIAEAHGGAIRLVSSAGEGTTVHVELPVPSEERSS